MRMFSRCSAVALMAACLTWSSAAQAELKSITIGSNRQGSVFYLLASGFAKELQQQLKVRSTAQPHAGSTVYLPVVDKGEMTLGINNSMDSGAATRGGAPFKAQLPNIRALARVWVIPYGILVKKDDGINTVADLKGKKYVTETGPIVNLTNLNMAWLKSAAMSVDDITAIKSGGIVDNVNKVVEGRADAAPAAMGMPVVRKAHASVPGGIKFLPIGPQGSDALIGGEVPGARTLLVKPSKRMPFVTEPITVTAFDAYLNAGSQVSEEDAYRIIKALHTEWPKLQEAYGPLRGVKQTELTPSSNPHPYHDGVVRYMKEVGLWTAENQAAQDRALAAMK